MTTPQTVPDFHDDHHCFVGCDPCNDGAADNRWIPTGNVEQYLLKVRNEHRPAFKAMWALIEEARENGLEPEMNNEPDEDHDGTFNTPVGMYVKESDLPDCGRLYMGELKYDRKEQGIFYRVSFGDIANQENEVLYRVVMSHGSTKKLHGGHNQKLTSHEINTAQTNDIAKGMRNLHGYSKKHSVAPRPY